MQRFGEKLRTLRLRRGLTLQELARELGLHNHSHLSNIETGKRKPSADLIIKIVQYFNIPADQLILDSHEVEE